MSESLRGRGGELSDSDAIAFEFEGERLSGRRGESLAAALTAAGIRTLRLTHGDEPRGLFCGMGVCQECLVEIDGVSNQRACMTKLERPVSIRRQQHLASASVAVDAQEPPSALAAPLTP
ncbi:MAG TPA: (2Fe-2S)-binding protein, partial [Stellaceae bacterium]|nr:(2Fe-2S)-binding protein [Stellaceae bacterium]